MSGSSSPRRSAGSPRASPSTAASTSSRVPGCRSAWSPAAASGTSSTAATTRRSAASWVDRRVRDQASGPENRAWETAGGPGLRGLQLARLANERVSEGGEGLPALRDRDRRKPGGWPAPRERSRRPTGSGGIPQCAAREAGRALTEPARRRPPRQRGEAERESAHAGRRGLGASRSAQPAKRASTDGARAKTPAPTAGGGRARERSRRPTGSGGIGAAQRPKGASSGRAPKKRRPSPRALTPADGVWGHRSSAAPEGREQRTGPQEAEAEPESAHAGRRGLGASAQRSARRARAADGPPESIDPCEAGGYLRARQSAHPREHPLAAAPEFPNISRT